MSDFDNSQELDGQVYRPSPQIVPDVREGYDAEGNFHAVVNRQALAMQQQGLLVRLTQTIMEQIAAENPYQPEYQFESVAYDLESKNALPEGVTAWDLVQNFTRFRGEGAL